MSKPHKWAKEIKAWADGAEIEVKVQDKWVIVKDPMWDVELNYRIKPQPKEPKYLYAFKDPTDGLVKLTESFGTFYGEEPIGKIKLEELS